MNIQELPSIIESLQKEVLLLKSERKPDRMLTISEAAELLNISRASFNNYRKAGLINALDIPGETKFSMEQLHAFMDSVKKN